MLKSSQTQLPVSILVTYNIVSEVISTARNYSHLRDFASLYLDQIKFQNTIYEKLPHSKTEKICIIVLKECSA